MRLNNYFTFANEAERDHFIRHVLRATSETAARPVLWGIEVRVCSWMPQGTAILDDGKRFVRFDIEQGFDANGSPA